jgi:hypothetical protein
MSNLPVSLNALFHPYRVCAALDAMPDRNVWPSRADCPLCRRGKMDVFNAYDGGWFRCAQCKRSGDMIDLASAALGCSYQAAITWLGRQYLQSPLTCEDIDRHLQTHVAIRARTIALRDRAAAHVLERSWWNSALLGRCWFPPEVPFERMVAGPGGVMGIADTVDVERCFSPATMREETRLGHRNNPSAHAVFRGRGWRDVMVFPAYDLPGRISGFHLIGREGASPDDRLFKGVARYFRGNQYVPPVMEAGLAMHPGVLDTLLRGNRHVVAIDDVVLAARLQLRHFERSRLPLPLVAWHDSLDDRRTKPNGMRVCSYRSWDMLYRFDIAHWMPKFRFSAVMQAMRTSSRVATFGPDEDSDESRRAFLDRLGPEEFIHRVVREARPLQEVLGEHLSRLSDEDVEKLYHAFIAEGRDPEETFAWCAAAGGARLAAARAKINPRISYYNRGTRSERDGAWFYKPRRGAEQQLCDAIVRIDSHTYAKRSEEAYLKGRILRADSVIPFSGQPLSYLEKHGDRWLSDAVRAHDGSELQCHRRLARELVSIAIRFHRPSVEPSFERLGWDGKDGTQYVLPGVLISALQPPSRLENLRYLGPWPRQALATPRPLRASDFAAVLASNDVNRVFWATAACLVANVLAPQWRLDPLGIALVGAGAQTVGREVAAAIGCAAVSVRTPRDFKACWEEEAAHDWPLYVERTGRLGFGYRMDFWRGAKEGPRKIVVAAEWPESRALLMQDRWIVVEGMNEGQLSDEQRAFAAWLMPAYLQDLFDVPYRTVGRRKGRSRLSYFGQRSWVDMVLEDLREFVERLAGRRAPVMRTAQQRLVGPGFQHGLTSLLSQALERRQLRVVEKPGPWNPRRLEVVRRDPDQWFMTRATLDALVRRTRGPDLNLAACRALSTSKNWRLDVENLGFVFSPQLLFARQNTPPLAQLKAAAA